MKTTFTLGIGIAAIVASVVIVTRYLSVTTPPAPLYISHSPRPTVTTTPSLPATATPTPVASTSGTTPTPSPAPTFIPGTHPTDWKTYKNYEWRFEVKIPPDWKAEQIGYGLVISGDRTAIRIDNDGVGGNDGATSGPSITTSTIDGQEVEIADRSSFGLKRNGDIPLYYFRISNWTDTVDKILSTFMSW
jgi:hypothetical protein